MEASVADLELRREKSIATKPMKVGLVLFALAWYITRQPQTAAFIVLAYLLLDWLL